MAAEKPSAELQVMLKLKSPANLALLSEGVAVTYMRLRPGPSETYWTLETNPPPAEIKESVGITREGRD